MREGGWKPRMTLCVSSQASTLAHTIIVQDYCICMLNIIGLSELRAAEHKVYYTAMYSSAVAVILV